MPVAPYFSKINVDSVTAAYERLGYPIYTKELSLNIFGIRTNENVANTFNDVVGVLYTLDGERVLKKYDATTDPGVYWRENPMNVNGAAVLQNGYHKKAFRIGMHQGKYEALVENIPFPLWRDNNKDAVLDRSGETFVEMAGVNLHHAGENSTQVDKWSAGCQVIAKLADFNELMKLVHLSNAKYGPVFSYALFTEDEFLG